MFATSLNGSGLFKPLSRELYRWAFEFLFESIFDPLPEIGKSMRSISRPRGVYVST